MYDFLGTISALLAMIFYGLYRLNYKFPVETKARLKSVGFPDEDTDAKAKSYARLFKLFVVLSVVLFVVEYIGSKS